jgi:hypothetical protein
MPFSSSSASRYTGLCISRSKNVYVTMTMTMPSPLAWRVLRDEPSIRQPRSQSDIIDNITSHVRWGFTCCFPHTLNIMSQRRVCDACAIRRVRCDGTFPCAGCRNASLDCTRIRQRHKSGPKGIKKRTLEKLTRVQRDHAVPQDAGSDAVRPSSATPIGGLRQQPGHSFDDGNTIHAPPSGNSRSSHIIDDPQATLPHHETGATWESRQTYSYQISVEHLTLYLDIYHHKLYPVWPIVDKSVLIGRLNVVVPDIESYILASSVCIATIMQLQLTATDPTGSVLQPNLIIQEIEALRQAQDYREYPTLDNIRASFFLHVAYLHMKKQRTSTLTLREAISMAHMLDLHKGSHYEGSPGDNTSEDLRVLWLLFITER